MRLPSPLRAAAALALLTGTACAGTAAVAHPAALSTAAPSAAARPSSLFTPPPAATASTTSPAAASGHPSAVAPIGPVTTPDPIAVFAGEPMIGGCQVFPSDNAWNTDVSRLPVDPNSNAYVARIDSFRQFLHPDFGSDPTYGIPYVVAPASQPAVPITFNAYPSESDPGPYPIPLSAPVEAGSDQHVLVVDSGTCTLYELYHAARSGNGWSADSGAVFHLNSNALRPDGWTSADAAGLPILPGLVRYDEVAAGVITHALRFTVDETQNGFIHPATHQAGSANAGDPPMGLRLRLRASFDLAPYHGAALVILTALKRYGMLVADNGSSWFVGGASDPRWNDTDLNQLKNVPGSAFEAVATGPIQH